MLVNGSGPSYIEYRVKPVTPAPALCSVSARNFVPPSLSWLLGGFNELLVDMRTAERLAHLPSQTQHSSVKTEPWPLKREKTLLSDILKVAFEALQLIFL